MAGGDQASGSRTDRWLNADVTPLLHLHRACFSFTALTVALYIFLVLDKLSCVAQAGPELLDPPGVLELIGVNHHH